MLSHERFRLLLHGEAGAWNVVLSAWALVDFFLQMPELVNHLELIELKASYFDAWTSTSWYKADLLLHTVQVFMRKCWIRGDVKISLLEVAIGLWHVRLKPGGLPYLFLRCIGTLLGIRCRHLKWWCWASGDQVLTLTSSWQVVQAPYMWITSTYSWLQYPHGHWAHFCNCLRTV